jgi:hypothetical protein
MPYPTRCSTRRSSTLLFDPNRDVRERAARGWCAWEDAHVSLTPEHVPNPRFDDAGRLHVLDDAGHGGGDTFSAAITGALSELATR